MRTMNTEDVLQKLSPWREKHQRVAWKPIVEDGDGAPSASKFAGMPWIGPDGVWPKFSTCNNPFQLFLQLDLASLSTALNNSFGTGLLQLFYCTNDQCEGSGGWEAFDDELSRVRFVNRAGLGLESSVSSEIHAFPPKRIIGWKEFLDWPSTSEQEELGLKYTYDFTPGT